MVRLQVIGQAQLLQGGLDLLQLIQGLPEDHQAQVGLLPVDLAPVMASLALGLDLVQLCGQGLELIQAFPAFVLGHSAPLGPIDFPEEVKAKPALKTRCSLLSHEHFLSLA